MSRDESSAKVYQPKLLHLPKYLKSRDHEMLKNSTEHTIEVAQKC